VRFKAGAAVNIWWQTLELPNGLDIARTTGYCPNDGGLSTTIPLVGGNLLLSSASTDSVALDGKTLFTLKGNGSVVQATWEHPCTAAAAGNFSIFLQAVTLAGLALDPFNTTLAAGSATHFVPGSVQGVGPPALLLTHQSSTSGSGNLCERVLNATPSDGGVLLSRALGSSSCTTSDMAEVSGARLFFGNLGKVQTYDTQLPAGTSSQAVTLTPVDVTRTLVFAGNQSGGGGQGVGESACLTSAPFGDVVAAHVLDAGAAFDSEQLFLARDSTQCAAHWTSYVVEIGP
jgi:hypothetical protein